MANTGDDTLLTMEEMKAINANMPDDAKYGDVFVEIAKAQLAKVKDAGYVPLADDQINLPEPNLDAHTAIVMFKAGWRKVGL